MRIPVASLPPGIIPDVDCHILRRLSSVTSPPNDSAPCCPSIPAHPQKVDGMPRNQWTTCSGFGGWLAPESVVAFDRITHLDWLLPTWDRSPSHTVHSDAVHSGCVPAAQPCVDSTRCSPLELMNGIFGKGVGVRRLRWGGFASF